MKSPRIKASQAWYVDVTQVIPDTWAEWFYCELADSGNITWGDADKTLIEIDSFVDIAVEIISDSSNNPKTAQKRIDRLRNTCAKLQLLVPEGTSLYINLES